MCWRIDKVEYEKNPNCYHKVAEEDVIVYKFGYKKYNKFNPMYRQEFIYKTNSLNDEISLHMESRHDECYYIDDDECYYIDEGYHSYSGECKILYFLTCGKKTFGIESSKGYKIMPMCLIEQPIKVGEFIIPKGSEYYENDLGEIVSSQIMWTGERCLLDDFELADIICDNKVYLKDLNYVLGNR